MADERRKGSDSGVVSRLAGRGEDAITRLMEELGRNSVVTEALARAMSTKGRLDQASRSALSQIGLAPSDEVRDLRTQVDELERRLARLEGGGAQAPKKATVKRSGPTKTASTSTKRSTKSAPRRGRSATGGTSA